MKTAIYVEDGVIQHLSDTISEPNADSSSNWIKVEDSMPTYMQPVIYFFKHVGVWRGHCLGKNGFNQFGAKGVGFLTGDVTHWMPDRPGELPRPTWIRRVINTTSARTKRKPSGKIALA